MGMFTIILVAEVSLNMEFASISASIINILKSGYELTLPIITKPKSIDAIYIHTV